VLIQEVKPKKAIVFDKYFGTFAGFMEAAEELPYFSSGSEQSEVLETNPSQQALFSLEFHLAPS